MQCGAGHAAAHRMQRVTASSTLFLCKHQSTRGFARGLLWRGLDVVFGVCSRVRPRSTSAGRLQTSAGLSKSPSQHQEMSASQVRSHLPSSKRRPQLSKNHPFSSGRPRGGRRPWCQAVGPVTAPQGEPAAAAEDGCPKSNTIVLICISF